MKKILLLFVSLMPLFIYSQAIQKGNIEFTGGTGFGIYGASDNESNNDTVKNNNTAVAGLLDVSFKYTISNKFNLGFIIERNGFAHDSSNKAHSINVGLVAQYLFVNKDKNVIYLDFVGGYSNFKYVDKGSKNWVTSNGLNIQPGIGFKHYFGKTLGFYLQSNYAFYSYNKIVDSNGNVLKTSNSTDYLIKLSGLNIKIGLSIKF